MDVGFVRLVEDFLNELRRNEIDAFAVAHNEVAWHYRYPLNANRDIDSGQHHIADWRGIDEAEVCGHVDLGDAIQIADAAVHHQPAAMSRLVDVEEEIVADDGAVHFFAK